MADWWDQIGTNIGNALIAPQTFGGLMPMPTDPAQRQQMIGPALLTLGAGLFQGARQGQGPLEAFASAYGGLQQQGAQQGQQRLQGMLLGSKLQEQQKKNQTREQLKKMPPPEGYTPQTWGAFVDAADTGDLLKIWQDSIQRQRDRSAIGGMGGFPGMGGPAGAPAGGGDAPTGTVPLTNDPVLDRIAFLESRGRNIPNAQGSGATGPFQIMPATWRGLVQKYGQSHGLTPDGINDPRQQAIAAPLLKAEVNQAFGGSASPGQTYLGWFLGGPAAAAFAQLPPDMSLDDALVRVYGPERARLTKQQNANFLSRMRTAGDLTGHFDRVMAGIKPAQMPGGPQTAGPGTPAPMPQPNIPGAVPGAQPAPTPEAVTPVQYTPGQGGQPAPQIDYQSDPVIREAYQAARIAQQQGDVKGYTAARQKAAERIAELQNKQFELEKSRVQGSDRAKIMRDTELLKTDIAGAAKISDEIQNTALKSRTAKANIQQLGALLEGIETGRFTGTATEIARIAKTFGIEVDKNLGRKEAALALMSKLALNAAEDLKGPMSDRDVIFVTGMIPGLETTPEGRKLMLGYMARIHDYNIGLAKAVQAYRRSPQWRTDPQGIVDAAREYAEANPIFNEADIQAATQAKGAAPIPTNPGPPPEAQTPGGIPTVRSADEYLKLPAGTQYRDPDGNVRTKR